MLAFGAVMVLLLMGSLAPVCMADDFPVSGKFQTRATVEKTGFDGFLCKLEQGDKMSWDVSLVSGDLLNIYVMSGSDYEKLKQGSFPTYFSQYSKEKTDFFEGLLNATGSPYTGDIVLVVKTQGQDNSTSIFDVDVKVTKAPTPQNLLDMICGLGPGICAILVIGFVVVIAIIYYIFTKVGGPMMGSSSTKDRSELGSVDSMARPGFSVKIGPEAEPKRAKPPKKGKPTVTRRPVQTKVQPRRPQRVRVPGKCPSCGERVDEGQGFCPACGADLE